MQANTKSLRVHEAAAVLGVSPDTVRRWADAGHLKFIKTPTGERRFKAEDLAQYATARRAT